MQFFRQSFIAWIGLTSSALTAEPILLDDQFVLPEGFHIYRAAERELTGGSYDLTFDGNGRLLVADGRSVRRLQDRDDDGLYDAYETIADGSPVGGRGPQGLLVYGDHLYAVGGDGVQLFSGYNAGGRLKHERRLGETFHTGGDHAAHTVLRGLDGFVYLVTGDGAGTGGRKHITEESSPVREERAGCVFRFDPEGRKWECVGSGSRNPPSLGMNYLGELFSFDSDMEFHVDVPFYRPVRLNHWATGSDQGWQQVGAYPPYYIDCLPGVVNVGRGSPNWGVVYEHTQLPPRYRDAFIVCDYRWKSATSGRYNSSGRLVVFHLQRDGATWKTEWSELATAKADAKDTEGRTINFALVDIDVAPDGSLFVTDHNQGVWRIFYDPASKPAVPSIVPKTVPPNQQTVMTALLKLPQPAAEWSRLHEEELKKTADFDVAEALQQAATDGSLSLRMRLRAIRLLASDFEKLPPMLIGRLAKEKDAEVRAQAAWLTGIRGQDDGLGSLLNLLEDSDPFVRRRAAEALSRFASPEGNAKLIERLGDADRFVRYAAMTALTHRPSEEFMAAAAKHKHPQILMRLLVAAHLRKKRPKTEEALEVIMRLLHDRSRSDEDELDLMRVLGLYRKEVESNRACQELVTSYLLTKFPDRDSNIRWEQIRLLGAYRVHSAFSPLVDQLLGEKDDVTQFHIASAIAEIPRPKEGWNKRQSERLADWLVSTQTGWFSEFGGKGLQFPGFWATVLNKLGEHHTDVLAAKLDRLDPNSQLAPIVFSKVETVPGADSLLIDLYQRENDAGSQRNILSLMHRVSTAKMATFLVEEFAKTRDLELRKSMLIALGPMGHLLQNPAIFLHALFDFEDANVIAACANALVASSKHLDAIRSENKFARARYQGHQAVHFRLLELMARQPHLVAQLEQTLSTLTGHQSPHPNIRPRCIWSSAAQKEGDHAWFAKTFDVPKSVIGGDMVITCDNEFVAYLNGQRVAKSRVWEKPLRVDIGKALRPGKNLIAIEGKNWGGPAGLVASLSWITKDGIQGAVVTNPTWRVTLKPPANWQVHGTKGGNWVLSTDVSGPTRNAIDAFNTFTGSKTGNEEVAIQEYWHKWYLQKYKEAFVVRAIAKTAQRANQDIHRLITGMKEIQGSPERGRVVYLKAGCYACHGGIENRKTTIFGPALGGVTLRLKRSELADSIVYPSKQVVERFKASVLLTVDGLQLSGFITEQSDEFVSITDLQNKVTRLSREEVESFRAKNKSLMPDKLLNGFTDEEIRDLLTFLVSLK